MLERRHVLDCQILTLDDHIPGECQEHSNDAASSALVYQPELLVSKVECHLGTGFLSEPSEIDRLRRSRLKAPDVGLTTIVRPNLDASTQPHRIAGRTLVPVR